MYASAAPANTCQLTDLNESENAGIVGVQAALKGETGKMITFYPKL